MKKLMLSVFAIVAVVFSANAQTPSQSTIVNGTGKAELVQIITLSTRTAGGEAGTLQFGQLAVPAVASTVTLTPLINATTAGAAGYDFIDGAVLAMTGGTAKSTAGFSITGIRNQTVYINLPAAATISNTTDGDAVALGLSAFTSSLTGNQGDLSSGAGKLNFFVGATLTIPATAFAGTYSGVFPVTVDYN